MDRYEEALERAKQGLPIDEVFPELKEGEDERIRKFLVELVSNDKANNYNGLYENRGVRFDDVLAYLEKQKEQKPAEWNEEDEAAFGDLMWCIEQARKSAKDENDMGNIWFAEKWVKGRIKSFSPQPKQEWSEEDEYKVDDICKLIEHATIIPRSGDDDTGIPPTRLNDKYKGELKAFIKSLRPQPKREEAPRLVKFAGKIYRVHGKKDMPGGAIGYIIEDEPGHYDCITNPEEVLGGGYGIKSNGSPFPTKEANYGQPINLLTTSKN